mmetsp:Transcript_6848/g.19183  ORF Transcript_6848/g.19183 Transcript_6848/m.19183 type:complete len:280 (-) Transcript_6848:155-994(-)
MSRARPMIRRASLTCSASTNLPLSVATPLPSLTASRWAATMACARSTSASEGEKTALAGSTVAGWMSVLPSKPSSRPWRHSRVKPSSSLKSMNTPSSTAFLCARAARTVWARAVWRFHRPGALGRQCSSFARSTVPTTRHWTRGDAPAMLGALMTPSGVSIMHHRARSSGAPSSAARTSMARISSAVSTLGTSMACALLLLTAARSSACHSVPIPFTRITISLWRVCGSWVVKRSAASTAMSRAWGLSSGATASSRSRMTPSAASEGTLARARGFEAGM